MSKDDLVALRLRAKVPPFNIGEIAGFQPGHARRLVELGKAVYMNPPPGGATTNDLTGPVKPVHLGGGWYQVGDRKVQGKAKALELARSG